MTEHREECQRRAALDKHFADAKNWVCECGQRCNPGSGEWRWAGYGWEHYHGYPIGHVLARKEKKSNA